MRATSYVHSSKESMSELGTELGLDGEALAMFRHALTEVEIEIEVDEQTGLVEICKVDGKLIQKEK